MRIVGDSPSPPPAQDAAARRVRLRWLAKRRCLRALRTTLVFMALVTPFLFFGHLLYCRMPFQLGSRLPNWILLYECWLFLRNIYILVRYVWRVPLLASLPVIVNIYFIFVFPHAPYGSISENLYFTQFHDERMQIITLVQNGILQPEPQSPGFIELPQPYTHLAMRNGLIAFMSENGKTSVVFATGLNFLSQDEGFCYAPDDVPAHWLWMERLSEIEKIETDWYAIYPRFGYFGAMLNWPESK